MSGHGWVTPNPDGAKARCGGPAICSACALELAQQQSHAAREATAGARLKRLGFTLNALFDPERGGEYFTVTGDNLSGDMRYYETIDQVERFIATQPSIRDETAIQRMLGGDQVDALRYAVRLIEQIRQPYVVAPVHYVSHGTPPRTDGSQAFRSVCRAAIVAEVNSPGARASYGIPGVTLCVLNPTGLFFQTVAYDPGTFTGPERTAEPGEGLPLITCADLEFQPGTWHWESHA